MRKLEIRDAEMMQIAIRQEIDRCFVDDQPERLIGDKAYDSDPLDVTLKEEGIEMIAPHRENRRTPAT